jgi:hypothetical protein
VWKLCVTAAAVVVLLMTGCGGSKKVDPDQGAAELGLNRGPQDYSGPATDAEDAARRLAARGVAALRADAGGTWTIRIGDCRKSGPVTSCDIEVAGQVRPGGKKLRCTASAAVRIRAERATARRNPYSCEVAG